MRYRFEFAAMAERRRWWLVERWLLLSLRQRRRWWLLLAGGKVAKVAKVAGCWLVES